MHIHPAAYGSALLVLPSAARRGLGSFTTGMTVLVLTAVVLFGGTYASRALSSAGEATEGTPLSAKRFSSEGLIADAGGRTLVFTRNGAVEIVPEERMRIVTESAARDILNRWERERPQGEASQGTTLAALIRDFKKGAENLNGSYDRGWATLLAYSWALALLISAFSPLSGSTRWPLADLALCALAFRGVLILERLASSGPVTRFIAGGGFGIPERFAAPAALGLCGFILASGGTLLRLAGRRKEFDD